MKEPTCQNKQIDVLNTNLDNPKNKSPSNSQWKSNKYNYKGFKSNLTKGNQIIISDNK